MKGPAGKNLSVAPRRLAAALVIAFSFAVTLAAADPTPLAARFFGQMLLLMAGAKIGPHGTESRGRKPPSFSFVPDMSCKLSYSFEVA